MIIALAIAFIWAMACLYFDAHETDKGIRAGVAVEGNGMITFFARTDKPKLWQLLLIDGLLRLAFVGVYFLPTAGAPPHTWHVMSVVMLSVVGLKNIQGGRKWLWMFNHPGQVLPEPKTAWGQFLGFWG